MANLTIPELPVITNATATDAIPAYQASTGQLTIAKILALLIDGAGSGFNTLQKLEVGKLSVDGSDAMDGDLDLNGYWIENHAARGILVREPQIITSTDTAWAYHTRTRFAIVELWGAGGAGGGVSAGVSGQVVVANGGTSGAYCRAFIDVTALSVRTANIQIGAAGTGSSGATGGAGGASSYVDEDTTLTANGGAGGTLIASALLIGKAADTAPSATGGDLNIMGANGTPCFGSGSSIDSLMVSQSGSGGNSRFGVGGEYVYRRNTVAESVAGNNASGFAAGGSGAVCIDTGIARAGGNGAPGLCIIWEYV